MTKLKQAAQEYEAKTTKLVSDLEKVSVDMDIEQRTYKEGEPEEYTVDVITVDGEDYRVPASVLKQLQLHLDEKNSPNLKHFKVLRQGTGIKDTKYTVIPLGI